MPGLVAPPDAPPLRIAVPDDGDIQIRRPGEVRSPIPKKAFTPSPSSSSRARPSPDRKKRTPGSSSAEKQRQPTAAVADEAALDNPDLGPFLLKLARDTIAFGEGPGKALELAMSLHVMAAIYCSLGWYKEVVPALERAVVVVPEAGRGPEHALAAFFGYMQLGDTHSMLGRLDQFIECYPKGLQIQMEALGESDPRVTETYRYLAEAHVQAMQFDEAEKLSRKTLDIHHEHSPPRGREDEAWGRCGRVGAPGRSWRPG